MDGASRMHRQPFSEHIRELRRRLIVCLAAILAGTAAGYWLHAQLFAMIQKPLGQQLYYTSPVGGLNAILKVSILFGLVVALPVIIHQLHGFLQPAFHKSLPSRSIYIIFTSLALAAIGAAVAYFISLPAALHFLTNLNTPGIAPFILVNEYMNFILSYIVGFAILFQLPLIILFINRVKPQSPRGLMRYQRYVILGSAIIAAILTPTPDPLNQAIMAAPIIILYQVSIVMIWIANSNKAKPVPAAPSPAWSDTTNLVPAADRKSVV